mmetsp:Transcript_14651/g.30968  ORF Transcript_14651/g.30968 Transcript_14651/m.30968 type:complete len:372 (+) Transcript_14651:243-1358(+)
MSDFLLLSTLLTVFLSGAVTALGIFTVYRKKLCRSRLLGTTVVAVVAIAATIVAILCFIPYTLEAVEAPPPPPVPSPPPASSPPQPPLSPPPPVLPLSTLGSGEFTSGETGSSTGDDSSSGLLPVITPRPPTSPPPVFAEDEGINFTVLRILYVVSVSLFILGVFVLIVIAQARLEPFEWPRDRTKSGRTTTAELTGKPLQRASASTSQTASDRLGALSNALAVVPADDDTDNSEGSEPPYPVVVRSRNRNRMVRVDPVERHLDGAMDALEALQEEEASKSSRRPPLALTAREQGELSFPETPSRVSISMRSGAEKPAELRARFRQHCRKQCCLVFYVVLVSWLFVVAILTLTVGSIIHEDGLEGFLGGVV